MDKEGGGEGAMETGLDVAFVVGGDHERGGWCEGHGEWRHTILPYLPTYLPLAYAQRDPFRRVHYRTTTRETSEYALLRDLSPQVLVFLLSSRRRCVCIALADESCCFE
jgi:hypothetical protein